jgi:DNA-binding NtrC family response regulator
MVENKFDAVVTDIEMPNMDGIILTREILKQYPSIPVMVMTDYEKEDSIGVAISVGAKEFIKKPFSLYEFAIRLHKMINDFGTERRPGSEKNAEKDIQDLMGDLEVALKKT